MNFSAVILYLHCVIMIYSSGPFFLSTLHFIKEGHVSETPDVCVFDIQPLLIKSLGECALHCGMSSLCIAFDYCFLNGLHTCRLRYGHGTLLNTTSQCDLYEMSAVSTILTLRRLNLEQRHMILRRGTFHPTILILLILYLNINYFVYILMY